MVEPTFRYAPIAASLAGDAVVVPAAPDRRIAIFFFLVDASGAVEVAIKSGPSRAMTGPMPLASAGSGVASQFIGQPLMIADAGQALVVGLSSDVVVGGFLIYQLLAGDGFQ